ncbi:hypothetical protein [Brevibacillus brevis]|uniref:Uncharacterized protein n=1 Tax=Brevibacillus brevis TaxID=1393 RepID=A0ABY9SX82_BREBE|nr:hypothetical protein [Brevibacillus brevis]WNC12435.1 hypothetical protein RGB73_17010 [Brevibacillus brevis]
MNSKQCVGCSPDNASISKAAAAGFKERVLSMYEKQYSDKSVKNEVKEELNVVKL